MRRTLFPVALLSIFLLAPSVLADPPAPAAEPVAKAAVATVVPAAKPAASGAAAADKVVKFLITDFWIALFYKSAKLFLTLLG